MKGVEYTVAKVCGQPGCQNVGNVGKCQLAAVL